MLGKTVEEHPLRAAILTVSNSRTFSDDTNGLMIQSALANYGHQVVDYAIAKDDKKEITQHIHNWVCSVDVVITSGGTGMAKRDVTLEAVVPMFDKELPGFSSMLTYFAYRRVCGVQALAYRSAAGLIHQCYVFCLPGLPSLIKTGMEKVILPELFHLHTEIKK
ncbi:molybdenum cofactor biosynthesis protein [Megasphaera cerevisiae DSM 20462]|uniref:Molybdenum cofactor biosynthesis protein B n=1 Tax=Megasphaera cerevisiae DSM 20462 TaxID=1122219 RepID=A0A0J6WXV4_9FIRM|nr:molybdenum cofactor biosynthesis protein [Megasphaera cerevisiae DSM 20462]OKY52741.1 molybdenum cofactor biosynthesis protein [Megasphaera cerevisiae]